MRKFILVFTVLAVIAGVSVYALACDHGKNTAAAASSGGSCSASKSAAAGSCPMHSSNATAADDKKGECSAHGTMAAGKGECTMHGSAAMADGKCPYQAAGKDCANYVYSVADMHGDCCVDKIQKAISGAKNVVAVYVDSDEQKAYVCTGTKKIDNKDVLKRLKKAGFTQVTAAGTDKECVHERAAKAAAPSSSS